MKRTIIASALAGLVGFGMGMLCQMVSAGRTTTTTRLSPDETLRARLVEVSPTWSIDRNFRIDLESLIDGTTKTIFHSPDEGRPAGSERLIWSKDGKRLLVVGRHCYVKDDLFLDNGDQLYFLHDIPSGKSWLNSDGNSDLPPLRAGTIEGIEFTEPVRLKVAEGARRDEGRSGRAPGFKAGDQDL